MRVYLMVEVDSKDKYFHDVVLPLEKMVESGKISGFFTLSLGAESCECGLDPHRDIEKEIAKYIAKQERYIQ